jgi:hypothetical protein
MNRKPHRSKASTLARKSARLVALIFLLCGILEVASAAESELFTQLMSIKAQDADLSTVPPQAIDGLKKEFRDVAEQKKPGDYIRARIYLLRFGDIATIDQLVREFEAYDSRTSWDMVPFYVERAKQPLLIGWLASSLYVQPQEGTAGLVDTSCSVKILIPPRRTFAASLILETIRESSEFSQELKIWAGEMRPRIYAEDGIRAMISWWEANRDAFQKRRYDLVQPQVVPSA